MSKHHTAYTSGAKQFFNLSALAVREKAITLFLLITIVAAGIFAFLKLGRAEDPTFTIKVRSEEHTSELQSQSNLVCRLLLEKKKKKILTLTCVTLVHTVQVRL